MKPFILLLSLNIFLYAGNGPSKEQLHDMLLDALPKTMCKEKLVFTECFSVTIQECRSLVAKFVTPCFRQFENEITENINREQFINIADDIGQCVGDRYYESLKKELKVDEACYDSLK